MSMTSLIQILKLNEPRTGVGKTGKPWTMQEAEVALLDDAGEIQQVGGLLLPRDMTGDKAPAKGVYVGSFALEADYKTRQVVARGRAGRGPAPPVPRSGRPSFVLERQTRRGRSRPASW